jgi:hypothetical protein
LRARIARNATAPAAVMSKLGARINTLMNHDFSQHTSA